MNKKLYYPAVAGIINLFLILPLLGLEIFKQQAASILGLKITYIVVLSLTSLTAIAVWYGFGIIGGKMKLKFLRNMSYVMIAAELAFLPWGILELFFPVFFDNLIFSIIGLVTAGLLLLLLGISMLPLKKKFKGLGTGTAVLNIIAGASYLSFIFFFVGILLIIPAMILQVMVLFKAAEKWKR